LELGGAFQHKSQNQESVVYDLSKDEEV